jgi:iron complex transport system substrate-binding protein
MSQNRTQHKSKWILVGIVCIAVFAVAAILSKRMENLRPEESSSSPLKQQDLRIISLAPSITETLFKLGLKDALVGVTRYCDYPPEAMEKPKTGGYFDPNYEAMIALRPNLVLLLPDHDQPREFFKARGIRTITLNHRTITNILESIQKIGDTCGVPEKAAEIVSKIEARMKNIKAVVKDRPSVKVMVAVGRDVSAKTIRGVYIAGNSGWYSELIELAGGVNAYDGDLPFPSVSAEGILAMNPTVIIEMLGDMEGKPFDTDTALATWQTLPDLDAVQNGRIHLFRDGVVVIPGPRFIVILEKMARLLHPDADWSKLENPIGNDPVSDAAPSEGK